MAAGLKVLIVLFSNASRSHIQSYISLKLMPAVVVFSNVCLKKIFYIYIVKIIKILLLILCVKLKYGLECSKY